MKFIFSFFLLLMLFLNGVNAFAQTEVEVSGKKYLLHPVKKGETTFSICQKYKVTLDELKAANPELTAVLKSGATVKIPVKTESSPQKPALVTQKQPEPVQQKEVKKAAEAEYYYHKVTQKQTIFSISRQYGITSDELIRHNLEIASGLKAGQVLKVPVVKNGMVESVVSEEVKNEPLPSAVVLSDSKKESSVQENSAGCQPISGKNTRKYKAALLLPLHLSATDQSPASGTNSLLTSKIDVSKYINQVVDSTSQGVSLNIDARVEGFVEFYEGALLALDSLQRKGMNIEMFVFDASNLKTINNLLQLEIFRELDLIIGPVLPELQETVAAFAAKNRIPMISPLAPNGHFEESNPYYFKVNPSREFQVDQTAQFVVNEFGNKNLILLQMSSSSNSAEAKLAELTNVKLKQAQKPGKTKVMREYSFQRQGLNAIRPMLDDNDENVFVIPSDNEAQVSVAVTNLTSLAEHYNIVLVGTSTLPKMKSIQTENFHRVRLHYLSPYFIDYTQPLTRRFVSVYRDTFAGEPSQFSFQGFDVTYYFLNALYLYGKDFRSCLPNYQAELTQMNFNFGKVTQMGGFMNKNLFVTSWERNFDVLKFGIVGANQPE
jgi:LysM repeat protein/ABC-type branched-subunit amino acid transport system substrate-binding protein